MFLKNMYLLTQLGEFVVGFFHFLLALGKCFRFLLTEMKTKLALRQKWKTFISSWEQTFWLLMHTLPDSYELFQSHYSPLYTIELKTILLLYPFFYAFWYVLYKKVSAIRHAWTNIPKMDQPNVFPITNIENNFSRIPHCGS